VADDLLARIDDLTSCPLCSKPMDQAAWTLYGVCNVCAEPADGRSDAVEHAVNGEGVRNDGGEVDLALVCQCTGLVHDQACPRRALATGGVRADEAAAAFATAVEPFIQAQREASRAEADRMYQRMIHGSVELDAPPAPTEEQLITAAGNAFDDLILQRLRRGGHLFEMTNAAERFDSDMIAWRMRWQLAARSARPLTVLSGITGDAAPPPEALTPAAIARAFDVPLEMVDPSAAPPKPLSTWQIITHWCQRRLACTRRRR
jgi:hypothetical protein